MAFGVAVWVLTAVVTLLAIANGPTFISFNNILGFDLSRVLTINLFIDVGVIVLSGFFGGLSLLASGELLLLFVEIADNTRIMRVHKDNELVRQAEGQRRRY
jgi:hypothetical protein